MSPASQALRYAEIRARFYPPTRKAMPAPATPVMLPAPTEADVAAAGARSWSAARREAHRLAVLAIYDEGVRFGRVRPWKDGDSAGAGDIVRQVCEDHGITIIELRGRGRSRNAVDARRRISLILRRDLGMSFPAIGRVLGRDHTSIMSLLGRIPDKRKKVTA